NDPEKAAKVKKFIKKLQRMGDVKQDEGLVKCYNDAADLYNKGKYKEAEAGYKKAIDMNPHYAPAHEGLGLTYIKMKKFEAAFKEFNEAVMIDPYTAESHYGLGIVYPIVRDDVDKAIKHFKRYLELSPKSADAEKVKGFIAKLTEKKQARRAEAQLYNKGVDAFDSGNFAQAASYYRQALKANSSYYEAYNGLGLALTQLKEYEDAIDAFESALDINPDYPDAHYGLGVVYPLVGEKTKAATHFWKYIGLKPDAPDMKQVLKWIEQLEG
ncbi:MAG TPA: tetratricopeptide repeat protein, partial [bacterium]|nr:tetratricopeptide repeat protein [bacterium]